MAKTESTLKNMFLTLFVIALVSGASLGLVYKYTKVPIDKAKAAKQQAAIKLVLPEYDNDPVAEAVEVKTEGGITLKLFPARMGGRLVGTAVETLSNKGFGGDIRLMVGFLPDGTINNYKVLEHKETPGLGSKMEEWFRPVEQSAPTQAETDGNGHSIARWLYGVKGSGGGNRSVLGKHPGWSNLTVSKDGGEIDAITAATISSRAFLDAVKVAYTAYAKHAGLSAIDGHSGATQQVSPSEEGGFK